MRIKAVSEIMLTLLVFSVLSMNIIGIIAQETHDVAVISVTPDPTLVELGGLVNIVVVVENQGTVNETFDVTVYYDTTTVETQSVSSLAAGANTSITFVWNTTGVYPLDILYKIEATASTVPGETDTADNTLVSLDRVRIFTSPYIAVVPHNTVNPNLIPGDNFKVSICTDYNGSDVWMYQFSLSYNPSVLHGVEVTNGDLITEAKDPSAMFLPGDFDNTLGRLWQTNAFFYYIEKPIPTTYGPGILANVTFTVVGTGDSDITLVESETKLTGYNATTEEFYEIVSDWKPDIGHILHGYFCNSGPIIHDIAVVSVTPSPTSVVAGELVNIMVVVENQGTVNEDFDVTAYYDTIVIGTKIVTDLPSGATTSLTFLWDTTFVLPGDYTITAVASELPGETDTEDNTLQSEEIVTVSPVGVHDIAVISVTASPTEVTAGELITLNVTVWNQGSFNETFEVRAYYDSITIDTRVESLPPGNSASFSISWNTTGVVQDVYRTKAEAILEGDADPTDNMLVDGTVTVTSPPAPPMLSIKLSGEHDYLLMENVKIRLAALVKDAATMEPVSDANVTIEIYGSDGVLWVSDVMVEMVASTGIYEWKSEGTIRQLRLAKGVYLVHVQASCQEGPTASDILEFHIDPPAEGNHQTLYYVAFTAVALVGLAGVILERRKIANRLRKLSRRR